MRKLTVFENVSLDGYFVDARGDMSWAQRHDEEWSAFASDNAGGEGALVFGRVTYAMMAAFWPTPEAARRLPRVAEGMNRRQKIVFSRTLATVTWPNTTLVNGDVVTEMRRLKQESGGDLVILGSGSLVAQLSEARLVDAYQLAVVPVALGGGRTLFAGLSRPLPLALTGTRSFANGNVVLQYELSRRD